MQGRVHFYEGYSLKDVMFPMRVFGAIGNSRGDSYQRRWGHLPQFSRRARWWCLRDHINLQGSNPLIGPNDERFGERFPDMTHAYAPEFRKFALEEAGEARYRRCTKAFTRRSPDQATKRPPKFATCGDRRGFGGNVHGA